MQRRLAIAGANAKTGAPEMGPLLPQSGAVVGAFEKVFPQHARKVLARLLGLTQSAARKKIEGHRALSLDEFAAMLRTPDGFRYLTAVMADSTVTWWRICAPLMEVADVQTMQIKARRKLQRVVEGAIDVDDEITAARARAEALLVHDENFMRPHVDALRAMAGVQHRAVAAPAGKGRGR